MRPIKYIIVALAALCCSGCGPDFGDNIYDWINDNARSYSERLTRADLQVRWLKAFTEHYRTISYHSGVISQELGKLSRESKRSEKEVGEGLAALLKRYDHSKSMLNELISVKEILERNERLFQGLDSIGNGTQFKVAGLRAIGKETLMRSFLEIGDAQANINRLRYQRLFSLKYSVAIGEDGSVSESVNSGSQGEGYSYSGSFEQFWLDNPWTGPILSLFIQDDIEDQIDKVWEALDRFDELCLKPHEQFAISQEYVDEARKKYRDHHQMADSIHTIQKQSWSTLFKWNVNRFRQAEAALLPYKIQLAEREFQVNEEIRRILTEETRFQLRNEMVNMVSSVSEKRRQAILATDSFDKAEKTEFLTSACKEALYVLKTLKDRKEMTSMYQEIDRHILRVKSDSTFATQLKSELSSQWRN